MMKAANNKSLQFFSLALRDLIDHLNSSTLLNSSKNSVFNYSGFFSLIAKNRGMNKQGHGLAFSLFTIQVLGKKPSALPRQKGFKSLRLLLEKKIDFVKGRHCLRMMTLATSTAAHMVPSTY